MPLECGECGQREKGDIRINSLCHHCGKPLCDRHRISILDDAFADVEGMVGNIAFHCDSCKRMYHPKAVAHQTVTTR